MKKTISISFLILFLLTVFSTQIFAETATNVRQLTEWDRLPDLPSTTGLAGSFVGVHQDALIIAGGANFPTQQDQTVWETEKTWHSDIYVLTRDKENKYHWIEGFQLDRPVAYGACVSTPKGLFCIGGNNQDEVYSECFLLQWDPQTQQITRIPLPSLPVPNVYGSATFIDDIIYLAGGQTKQTLDTSTSHFWSFDLDSINNPNKESIWKQLPSIPGPTRSFNLTTTQHNGFNQCVYVMSGRRQKEGTQGIDGIELLTDVYEFDLQRYAAALKNNDQHGLNKSWKRRKDLPTCTMAGTALGIGQSHILVLSGADGSLLRDASQLKDKHPGFPKKMWLYHAITDTWIDAGNSPQNQVTTPAVKWNDDIILASGEIRPRVRTAAIWRINLLDNQHSFGIINFSVLIIYLLAMVGVGIYFAKKNKNTDDYFRGGQQIPWWAAGCSIFATMLSSITFMAIPSKAYAQDLVYLLGAVTILAMAPIASHVALPFFRRIDATSAYEYLSKRFNYPVRLIASGLFTLFHISRMGIVMSLAGLALSSVTPLSATHAVLIMGLLCMIYCTLGGIEAVIWTDTIQTFVLLSGAILCLVLILLQVDDGIAGIFTTASNNNKLHMINWDFSLDSYTTVALWVVLFGNLGGNFSSYVSDQAVVQRYMTTPNKKMAVKAIWMNAIIAIPASLLFYVIGTCLYVFYKQNPTKLDPTINTDQVFPLFISTEVFVGVAGLVVAGVFAAAQSTVSTSMNSAATTIVTDFIKPFNIFRNDKSYLRTAYFLTFMLGASGTLIGLIFVDPQFKSLFDEYLRVIGMFMGILGGLFALGMFTKRANGWGAIIGLLCGGIVMLLLPIFTNTHPLAYATIGIAVCFSIGYLISIILPASRKDLHGLTVFSSMQAESRTPVPDLLEVSK
ncbi:sodium:solute symporter family transporter [Poriferisphaera sp. WC338]|uniref:sodium:solute symporter family transporter n=1 Tax=Poriferisphaera sp. WC338 TaxID=3425129 RepID=UPI003D8158CB